MRQNFLIGFLLMVTLGICATEGYSAALLTDGEMDGIVAGLLDAEAEITVNAGATTTCGDGAQCWSNSTGGGTGVAEIPIYNGQTVKNITGDAAVAHNGGTATVDNSNNSDNSNQVHVSADGDAAVAHSGGTATVDKSDNSVNTLVGGAWTATGHGNNGDVMVANEDSTVTTTESLTLSDNVQQNATALFIVNTLGQVGNGFNLISHVNSSGGGAIGNLNTGAIATEQTVANFSNVTGGTTTINVTSAGSSTGS